MFCTSVISYAVLNVSSSIDSGQLFEVLSKMLKENAMKLLDGDGSCKIHLQESGTLLGSEKTSKSSQNSQMCIEFSDLCYSVRNRKGKQRSTYLRKSQFFHIPDTVP